MVCNNCGNSNADTSRFCENCGADLSVASVNQSSIQMNNQGMNNGQVYQKINNNNSKIIIAIIVAIIAIGGIVLGINDYKSKNVSKKTIKNDFIGAEFGYESMSVVVSEDNLKSIELGEKTLTNILGEKMYYNTGTIKFETDKYKLELPIEVTYIYNNITKEWELKDNIIDVYSKNVNFEIKEKLSEETIKSSIIGVEFDDLIITEDIANEMKVESIEKDSFDLGYYIVKLELENKGDFVTRKVYLEGHIDFDGESWGFREDTTEITEESIVVDEPSSDIGIDVIKKNLLMIINNNKFLGYKAYKKIEISLDDINSIENLEVDSIRGTTYIINADVAGEDKNNGLAFDGIIKIEASKDGYVDCEIEFDNILLENPTEEHLKEEVAGRELSVWIDKKSNSHIITDKDMDNFKINEIINAKNDPFTKHVYVNMTYTEQGKTITSDSIYIKMTYSDSETGWEISKMVSSTDTSFARYYGKDVINK